jgi:hypothetical protein
VLDDQVFSMTLFTRMFASKAKTKDNDPAAVYLGLRTMVLASKPATFGDGIWGLLMETGYPNGVATLVALADGTVSLYYSRGGGILGLGPHEGPRTAAAELLDFAPAYTQYCQSTDEFPLPHLGHTRFYVVVGSAILTTDATESDLGNRRHALSPLFHKCHELIT